MYCEIIGVLGYLDGNTYLEILSGKYLLRNTCLGILAWKYLLRNIIGNGLNPYGKNSTC